MTKTSTGAREPTKPSDAIRRGLASQTSGGVDLFVLSARTTPSWDTWFAAQSPEWQRWLRTCHFDASAGQVIALPAPDGSLGGAAIGLGERDPADPFSYTHLAERLPPALYALKPPPSREVADAIALGWALGTRARRAGASATLTWPHHAEASGERAWAVEAEIDARTWIETAPCDLAPEDLVEIGRAELAALGGQCRVVNGPALRESGYPGLFHVGKGSARAPALLDATWGPAGAPKVTLVGKGVCFDAGGVNVKSFRDMAHMKTDMAGAAQALALGRWLAKAKAPVRLRVLIPAADNMPSGSSSMSGDVIRARNGLTIEMVHTDYEGRVLLADALSAAAEDKPDLLIDFSTLTDTGLGSALAGFYTADNAVAAALADVGATVRDPVWRLPLWQGYRDRIQSPVADLANRETEGTPIASIAAALFLEKFAHGAKRWVHFDFDAWNTPATAQRPEGANVAGLRAAYALVRRLFG